MPFQIELVYSSRVFIGISFINGVFIKNYKITLISKFLKLCYEKKG